MTEAEWLNATDPTPMLEFLRGKASDRKGRLFGCACCRRIWNLMTDARSQKAVEVAERHAEGLALDEELTVAWHAASVAAQNAGRAANRDAALYSVWSAAMAAAAGAAVGSMPADEEGNVERIAPWYAASNAARYAGGSEAGSAHLNAAWAAASGAQANLIRDLVGNPLHLSPPAPPAVLAWNNSTVRRLAEGIYDERRMPEGTLDKVRLAILADALLDSGCDNDDIITHCRQQGEHVRGCWVIDLLLGKS
jgi:hypothetical protein